MKNLTTFTKSAITITSIVFLMTGCIDDEFPLSGENVINVEEPVAYVSVYQASPGTSNAEVIVDGKVITDQLDFGQQAKYMRIGIGNKTLSVRVAGREVAKQPITLQKDLNYSLYLIGDKEPSFMVMPVTSNNIAEGHVRITFLNLSPDASEADLVVDQTNEILFKGMSFKEAPGFVEIPEQNSYDLTLRSTADNSVLIQIPPKRLKAGWNYTVILRGYNSKTAEPSLRLTAEILGEVQN